MLQRWAPWALAIGIVAAIAAWAGVRSLDSWRLQSSLKAAKEAISTRAPVKARAILADASARWPKEGEFAFLLGAVGLSLSHREAAEAAWSRVPADSPFAPHAAMYRARLVLEHDRFADAEGFLLTALKGSGKHAIEARDSGQVVQAPRPVRRGPGSGPRGLGFLSGPAGTAQGIGETRVNESLRFWGDQHGLDEGRTKCPGRRPDLAGLGEPGDPDRPAR